MVGVNEEPWFVEIGRVVLGGNSKLGNMAKDERLIEFETASLNCYVLTPEVDTGTTCRRRPGRIARSVFIIQFNS